MVTVFFSFPSFEESIACLDNQRLGKQRVECKQILKALVLIRKGEKGGYTSHPATRMFVGYEDALILYYNLCLDEWERRGYANTMEKIPLDIPEEDIEMPWYMGWDAFHKSHQASLLRKHPEYYRSVFPSCEEFYQERGYIWPSHHEDSIEEVLSIPSFSDDHSSYCSFLGKKMPLFAPINQDTMRGASRSKERLYTVKDLKEMARQKGIVFPSSIRKAELLSLLGIEV